MSPGFLCSHLRRRRALILLRLVANHFESDLDHIAQHIDINIRKTIEIKTRLAGKWRIVFANDLRALNGDYLDTCFIAASARALTDSTRKKPSLSA